MDMERFSIGPWLVDPSDLTVSSISGHSRLQSKTMALLRVLQNQRGQVLGKDQLSDLVWGDEGASDELIARHISMIRRALQEDARRWKFLETVPKLGYRLVQDGVLQTPSRKLFRSHHFAALALVLLVLLIASGVRVLWPGGETAPQLSGRLLESGRPMATAQRLRTDVAASLGNGLIAFIESDRINVGGTLVVQNLRNGE